MRAVIAFLISISMILLVTWTFAGQGEVRDQDESASQVMVLNITSGPEEDAHSVTMALQLAGHALDDGREVVLFFNVRGVSAPTKDLPEDLAFKDKPIKTLLAGLIERGAQAHVCPHCMKALGVSAADLIEGAIVTDREKLFTKIGPNTVVFSY
jgi:predicted peroxiredoxin